MKKSLFVCCTFIMCIMMLSSAFATESSDIISWTVEDGVLTISGSGEMDDFAFGDGMAPWYDEKENVTKIVIEEGITYIGQYAFYSFTNVTEVSLPTSLLTIGDAAFWNCFSIEKINIPKNVNVIFDQSFGNCSNIVAFDVDSENEYFTTVGGVLFNKDVTKLVRYAGGCGVENYTVPATVTEIGGNAFDSCGVITNVTLPTGLTSIGSSAFAGCFRLESIMLPSGVTRIENYTFEMCSSLKNITFSDNITYVGKEAFLNCTMLETLILPASIKEIDSGAFNYCAGLKTVNIPASLETMNSNAFSACSKLTSFTVDAENTHFTAEDGILFSADKTKLCAFPAGKSTIYFVLPESVVTIGDSAFRECKNLKSIETSKNTKYIGDSAFSSCTSLEKVVLSKATSSIGDIAFYRCTALKDFTVYALDTEFALSPFEMCSDELVISCIDGSSFEKYAKENSITYTLVTSPEVLSGTCGDNLAWTLDTESGEIVISGNGDMLDFDNHSDAPWYEHRTYIKKVTVADGVTSIGAYAFDWVYKNLSEVVLADSVKTVNYKAFSELISLTDIDLGEGIETIGMYAFNHTSIEKLVIPASVQTIEHSAFDNCNALVDLTFADGVDAIEAFAFNYCTSLKAVIIPDSVTKLGKGVFAFSNALEDVTVGNGVKELPIELFCGCEALKKVIIGSGVEYIDSDVFFDCYALEEITIPDNVLTIDTYAFRGSYNLKKITISPYTMFLESGALDECETPTIYGYEPSVAKDYAEENGHKFVSLGASPFVDCGVVGEKVYWILDYDGTIKINGVGAIKEYSSSKDYPWKAYSGEIKSVEIGDGITTIPFGAFFFYTGIDSIKIADTVRKIGSNAFCFAGISTLEIPKSVTEIGEDAFKRCANLTSVTIGREVEIIGEGAFENCAEGFTVYGYKGTAAEEYAATDDAINFVALNISGDVDGDGELSVKDVLVVLKDVLNGEYSTAADLDGDGKLSLIDVLKVLKAVAA